MRIAIVTTALCTIVIGCGSPPPQIDRRAQLLSMAVSEATQIPDAQARLKRQLNLADRQVDDDHPAEARQTLAAAATTMRETNPAELPTQIRVAGWVSISELSRRAKDVPAASAACDRAVETLRSLDPPTERAQYAVGVAREVRELSGKPPAARLLVESGAWAAQVKYQELRRKGLKEIADAIFDCDDYTAGLNVLRVDPDPAWRSDALASLASSWDWASNVGNASVPRSIGGIAARDTATTRSSPFEKAVDYQSVFSSP